VDRVIPAGTVADADGGLQALDSGSRLLVLGLAGFVIVEMTEIGGHDDRRLRPAPKHFEHARHMIARRFADEHRQNLDISQCAVNEGQMHFQAVFAQERGRRHRDALPPGERIARHAVDGQRPEGRIPGIGRRKRHPAHGHAVIGPQQDHALDLVLSSSEQMIGGARDVAGIDVACMRCDHRFGRKGGRRRLRKA